MLASDVRVPVPLCPQEKGILLAGICEKYRQLYFRWRPFNEIDLRLDADKHRQKRNSVSQSVPSGRIPNDVLCGLHIECLPGAWSATGSKLRTITHYSLFNMTNLLHHPGPVPQRCLCRCSGFTSVVHYTRHQVRDASSHADRRQVLCVNLIPLQSQPEDASLRLPQKCRPHMSAWLWLQSTIVKRKSVPHASKDRQLPAKIQVRCQATSVASEPSTLLSDSQVPKRR